MMKYTYGKGMVLSALMVLTLNAEHSVEQSVHQVASPAEIFTEVSCGELVDKITILQIKKQRIHDSAKLRNIEKELAFLQAIYEPLLLLSQELPKLQEELFAANLTMWELCDALREKERLGVTYGDTEFVTLARNSYRANDARVALKRKIDQLLGSRIIEEKMYAAY